MLLDDDTCTPTPLVSHRHSQLCRVFRRTTWHFDMDAPVMECSWSTTRPQTKPTQSNILPMALFVMVSSPISLIHPQTLSKRGSPYCSPAYFTSVSLISSWGYQRQRLEVPNGYNMMEKGGGRQKGQEECKDLKYKQGAILNTWCLK